MVNTILLLILIPLSFQMFVFELFPNIAPTQNVHTEFLEDNFERDLSGEHIFNELGESIPQRQRQPQTAMWNKPEGLGTLV